MIDFDDLVTEWEKFCDDNKLERISADELLVEKTTPNYLKPYIRDFIDRWQYLEGLDNE